MSDIERRKRRKIQHSEVTDGVKKREFSKPDFACSLVNVIHLPGRAISELAQKSPEVFAQMTSPEANADRIDDGVRYSALVFLNNLSPPKINQEKWHHRGGTTWSVTNLTAWDVYDLAASPRVSQMELA